MGWETRNGRGAYYTRSRREGGRVVREYIGTGTHAEFMALLDEGRREERELEAQKWRAEREQMAEIDNTVAKIDEACSELTRAYLMAAGYHQHKGQWRRKSDY